MARVDVLIPTYNRTVLLREAVDSVLQQTMQDFTIIIYDDGSTDGSIEELPDDPRIRVIRGKENRGIGHARRRLIEEATSEWCAWLDSDDLFVLTKLEKQLAHAEETGVDIVTVYMEGFGREGFHTLYDKIDISIWKKGKLKSNTNSASMLFRTSVGKKYKHNDGLRIRGEDPDWLMQLIRGGATASLLPEILYRVRQRGGHTRSLDMQRAATAENKWPRCYWYCGPGMKDRRNFGDQLSAPVVRALSGVWPRWEPVNTTFIIGSILGDLKENCTVWGTGFMAPPRRWTPPPGCTYTAFRGPLTRAEIIRVGVPAANLPEVYGDPGLLVRQFSGIPIPDQKTHRVGVIPHFVDYQSIVHLEQDPAIRVIDVTQSVPEVIRQAVACESIVSTSLHGLILADSYGIPTAWLRVDGGKRLRGNGFKFKDYFASTERPLDSGVDMLGDDTQLPEISFLPPPVLDLDALVRACPFNRLGLEKAEDIQPVEID